MLAGRFFFIFKRLLIWIHTYMQTNIAIIVGFVIALRLKYWENLKTSIIMKQQQQKTPETQNKLTKNPKFTKTIK